MIRTATTEDSDGVFRIEVLSNLSLTLEGLAGFFLALSAASLTVALLPTLLGYWPIMAIAIVNLIVVGWCFRTAWLGHWARQDITVEADRVRVASRTAKASEQYELPTGWVRVEQCPTRDGPRIFLALHGKRIEIGGFVPAEERMEVARYINRALAPYSAWNGKAFKKIASSG